MTVAQLHFCHGPAKAARVTVGIRNKRDLDAPRFLDFCLHTRYEYLKSFMRGGQTDVVGLVGLLP